MTSVLTEDGRIEIPRELCEQLGFQPGNVLETQNGLSVYDAAYLELAARRKLPLASREEALRKAASGCGVKLLL